MTQPELQQEIEQTRERLGQTVEELAAKADVRAKAAGLKAKAQDQAARLSRQVSQSQTVRRDWPLALVAAGILAIGAALAWRRRTT